MKLNFDLEDLTNSALKRLVKQLLMASDAEEKKIMAKYSTKSNAKNDLADLDEQMHGKPNTPMVDDADDPFELEASGGDDDSETDAAPKKKGKK